MPDTHDTARTTADASTPLLSFPDALTSEAASMLLGGDVGGLKAVQEKLAAALAGQLAGQGVPGTDAGRLADGWVQSFASGMGTAASPEAAIAEASRITAGVAERMAQAVQEAAGLTGEQRLAAALAQGQNVTQTIAQGTAMQGTAIQGTADGKSPASLTTALFDGVMDQLARPAGSADPMAALSQALNSPVPTAPATAPVDLSPAEKLTAALASGVAVTDAVKTLGGAVEPVGAGLFAETLERALSSGEDAASAVAAATERAAQGGAQTQSVAVEQSGGDRLMTALAAGGADAVRGAGAADGQGAAFANVLNDALARGAAPDAALGASARAQADMTAQESAAGVAPKPADALVASLASGRNVTETVKSFAAAAGLDGAAGGFGQALGSALSSGQEAAGALGAARQDVAAANAMAAESARGVKGDGLVTALASGQNVQDAVQSLGGSGGAFSDALGRALAEGRSPGQALAAARQAADIAQQNSQASEVPVSPENQALANLATPGNAEAPAEGEKTDKAEAKGEGKAEAATQVADSGEKAAQEKDGEKDGEKDAGKDEAKDGKDTGDKAAADAPAASSSSDTGSPQTSMTASKSADTSGPALKSLSFAAPDGGSKATTSGDSASPAPAASEARPASTAPVSKSATTDPFTVAAQTQQRVAQSVAQAAENAAANSGTTPGTVPGAHHAQAPTLASGFDAAALAKALAVAEGTAAPAGFTVFHLIEAMFRPGEAGSSVVGVAIVANGDSALGVWQYSTDGANWQAIGTVSDASALVLSGNTLLRFLPAVGASGAAPALGLRAVNDEWTGGFGTLATLGGTGGTSPLSAEVGQLSLEVTPVNGAPVATGLTATLDAIAEDSANPAGASVSSLFAALFSDPTDAVFGAAGDGFAGVAVVADAATAAQGEWQYWNGSAWTAIGAVSAGSALLLAADAKLRFLPAADWNGTTPALTLRLVDDSEGTIISGTRVSLEAGTGGTTRYSAETIALAGAVTAVNDAPVATGTGATLPAVAEDTADPAGATVSSLFGALFSDPKDALGGTGADSLAGVAIVGGASDPAQGVWQYWNGSAWTAVGAVSEGNALVVLATDKLRFVPTADWNGPPPSLTVRLIDSSATLGASGTRVDLGSLGVGGATPYSATTITLDSRVTAVNDAPIATGNAVTMATIAEDATNPAGSTVAALFAGLFSDPADAVSGGSTANGFAGVAVVGNDATAAQGLWQYWSGSAWADVGAASAGNALLLAADAKLRFLPAADWNGTTPTLTLRLVDDSEGTLASGTRIALSGSGGSTRYSAETIALTGAVTAVNDAPVATGTAATLPTIAEDSADPAGATVTSLFGALFSDAADSVTGGSTANGFAGIAIVGDDATTAQGFWQYWTGTAWVNVGAVSEGSALVVAAADKLRFVPAADWNGTTPALTVRLIEQSATPAVTGGHVDLTAGVGGSTAYSADTITLTGTVTPVNDAPQVTAGTASLTTVKGVAVAVTGLSVSDIDAGSTPLLVTLTAGHGVLMLNDGGLDAVITGNGTDSVTVRATLSVINSLLGATNGLLYTASSYTGADTIGILVDDQGGGGAGGPLTATASVGVTVKPPNASPVLADTDLQLSTAGEALAAPGAGTAGIAVSKLVGLNGTGPANVTDGDSGAVTGIALVGTNESYGHWWYSTDSGASWHLVGAVNDSDSALLLGATDRLYFQPNASVPGTVNAALTIRAWDQTTGTHGTKVAVDTTDGSAFSSATDSVTLHPGVLIPNGSFDNGLTGWTYTGGTTVGTTGDGHEGTITSAGGQLPTQLEDFLGLTHGSIATAAGTTPSAGHAMKLASTVTVTEQTTLTFHWSFTFTDSGTYQDFAFVSVNGVVTLLAKAASASGTFTTVLAAGSTLSLGFGASDTGDNSVNPTLTVDNIKLTTVASDPIVLDLTGDGLALRALSDGVQFDVTGDGVADRTGWIGAGNALLVRDENHNGRIDDAHELVSEQFGKGFNSSLEALASLDDNHDGRLDATDAAFATLQVWQDHNADGVSQTGELRTLAEAGIRSIATTSTASDATLAGNRILGTTSVTMADGSIHAAAGVAFDVKAAEAAQVQTTPQTMAQVANQSQTQLFNGGHDGTDFAALLSSGLGLPGAAPVAVDGPAFHGTEWAADTHDPNGHHAQPHDPSGVHASGNA